MPKTRPGVTGPGTSHVRDESGYLPFSPNFFFTHGEIYHSK